LSVEQVSERISEAASKFNTILEGGMKTLECGKNDWT
jgi:hypothetical protein